MQGIDYQGGESYTRVDKAILRNNISFNGEVRNIEGSGVDASNNSWDIPGLNISEADFVTIDTAGVFGPRKEGGSLPDVNFMHLAKNSQLIDKGKDVGLPFNGEAPDLGAFEYRDPTGIAAHQLPEILHPGNGVAGRYEGINGVRLFDISGRLLPVVVLDRRHSVIIREPQPNSGSCYGTTQVHLR